MRFSRRRGRGSFARRGRRGMRRRSSARRGSLRQRIGFRM